MNPRPEDLAFPVLEIFYGTERKKGHRILQNDGFTCPLVGICNALLLKDDLKFNKSVNHVTYKQLEKCLSGHFSKIFERDFNGIEDAMILESALTNTELCVTSIPRWIALINAPSININIKFSDCDKFEYEPDMTIFETLNIKLLHGCVIDPNDELLYSLLVESNCDDQYQAILWLNGKIENQQSSKINSNNDKKYVRKFLDNCLCGITQYGMKQILSKLDNNEFAILYRNNNNFSPIIKYDEKIYELCTDAAIVEFNNEIAWQTLPISMKYQQLLNQFNENEKRIALQMSNIINNNNNNNDSKNKLKNKNKFKIRKNNKNDNNNNNNNNNSNSMNDNDIKCEIEKNELRVDVDYFDDAFEPIYMFYDTTNDDNTFIDFDNKNDNDNNDSNNNKNGKKSIIFDKIQLPKLLKVRCELDAYLEFEHNSQNSQNRQNRQNTRHHFETLMIGLKENEIEYKNFINKIKKKILMPRQSHHWKSKFTPKYGEFFHRQVYTMIPPHTLLSNYIIDTAKNKQKLIKNNYDFLEYIKSNNVDNLWVKLRIVQRVGWQIRRIVWIAYHKNEHNEMCIIKRLPKDVLLHILSFT